MKKIRFVLILFLLVLTYGNTYSQSTPVVINSVKEAQDYALQNNVDVLNSKLDIKIAKNKIWETTAIGLPRLSGDINYQQFIDIPTSVVPASVFDPTAPPGQLTAVQFGIEQSLSAGITANLNFFDGSYIVGLIAARTFAELSVKNAKSTAVETKYMVSKAYYTFLGAKKNEQILEQNVQSLKKIFKEVEATYQQGFSEKLDRDRAELSLRILEAQLNQVTRQSYIAKQLLKFQIGFNLQDSLTITDSIQNYLNNITYNMLEDVKVDYLKIIDYQLLLTQLSLKKLDMRRYQSQYLPSLGLFYNYSQNAYNTTFDFFNPSQNYYPTTMWGINIRVPLFNSFGQRTVVRQAMFEFEKVKNQRVQLEQKLDFDLLQASAEYKSTVEQATNQKRNMELAKRIYDKTLIKYKVGVGSSVEVNNAESKYFEIQSLYYNTVYQLLLAKTELNKALGNYDF